MILKQEIEEKFKSSEEKFSETSEQKENIPDPSLPGDSLPLGSRHPLSIVQNQMVDIFKRMGFIISEGP
jgi:phenylalanyl-tRNA synthetase alpha chain